MSKIIDLTHTFTHAMPVHIFDEPVTIQKIRTLDKDKYNDWRLCSGMHAGTHIDGPGHLTNSSTLLCSFPIETFIGTGYLIDARNKPVIDVSVVKNLPAEENLIVLMLTGSDKKFGTKEYFQTYPVISQECATALVKHKVKMVGIDFFSPDQYPFPVHKIFLENNVLIIENLNKLEQLVGVKKFAVIALPIKTETDSALARVIVIIE
jgi:kynurenine formamidase